MLTLLYNNVYPDPSTLITERQIFLNGQVKFFIRSYDKFLVQSIIIDNNNKIDIIQEKTIANYRLKSNNDDLFGYSVMLEEYKLPIKSLLKVNLQYIFNKNIVNYNTKLTYLQKVYFGLQYFYKKVSIKTNFMRFLTKKNFLIPYLGGFLFFQKSNVFNKEHGDLIKKLKHWHKEIKNLKEVAVPSSSIIRKILLWRINRYNYLRLKIRQIKTKRKKIRKGKSHGANKSPRYSQIIRKVNRFGNRKYIWTLR